MWAVVPVKDLAGAKQRLASVLDSRERLALYRAMLEDVLSALAATRGLDGVALVSRDGEAAGLAARFGARVIAEPANRGHRAAVSTAARVLATEGADGLLQLPGDLPLASAAEIETVLAAHGRAPAVTLVPSHDGLGTNCLAASPPEALPFLFGDVSFEPHRLAARERGIEPAVLHLPGLGLDIDTPDDLALLLARPGRSATRAYLERSGIARRLAPLPGARGRRASG
jgi:2-phospho-L-lactate guanylyltransferase